MSYVQGLEYAEAIEPTRENVLAILRLRLQDERAAGFKPSAKQVNPDSEEDFVVQRNKLIDHPEYYSGYTLNGELVAFMKQNEWFISDELPFARPFKAIGLLVRKVFRLNPSTGEWGVFALIASRDLKYELRGNVLADLLTRAYMGMSVSTINIPIYERDRLRGIALSHGFVAVGKWGEAAGAPGLKQRRYQLTAFK